MTLNETDRELTVTAACRKYVAKKGFDGVGGIYQQERITDPTPVPPL